MMDHIATAEDHQRENRHVDGIEGIAARIHERAVQLSNEQEVLRNAEQELRKLKEQLEREKEINQVVRARYLQNVTKLNSIEMECIQLEGSIKEGITKTKSLKEKEKEILASLTQKDAEWDNTEHALTRHTLRQELYLKVLEGVIDQRTQAISRRKSRLETAKAAAGELKHKEKMCIQKQGQMNMEMKRIVDAEGEENKVIDIIASQVRDALTKVRVNAYLISQQYEVLISNSYFLAIAIRTSIVVTQCAAKISKCSYQSRTTGPRISKPVNAYR
jgi:uncharacterized phage infection (PIP) family protein YhgE